VRYLKKQVQNDWRGQTQILMTPVLPQLTQILRLDAFFSISYVLSNDLHD
jgi:hypothetical protein